MLSKKPRGCELKAMDGRKENLRRSHQDVLKEMYYIRET